MKVNVSMIKEVDKFTVDAWWATAPDFVIDTLRRQLEAACSIWPELRQWELEPRRITRQTNKASLTSNKG